MIWHGVWGYHLIYMILNIVDALLNKSSSLSHPQLEVRTKQIKPHHCTQCSRIWKIPICSSSCSATPSDSSEAFASATECRTGITSAFEGPGLLLSLSHLENMKKDQVLKTGSYNYNLGRKNRHQSFYFAYNKQCNRKLLYSLYARDVPYLKDQASWTSSQLDKAHIVTVLVLTLPYLLPYWTNLRTNGKRLNELDRLLLLQSSKKKLIAINLLFLSYFKI